MTSRVPSHLATPPSRPLRAARDLAPRRPIVVRRFAGPTAQVGAFARPIRVAHLTDQHVGWATPHVVQQRAIERVLAIAPDVVLLTGDYIGHRLEYLETLAALLGRIPLPMVGVLGNHDHWTGADAVRRTLDRAGVAVLDNASTVLTVRGERLQVVGLDDGVTGHADRRRATRGLDRRLPTVGLSHFPEEADGLWASGVPLVLSGHTHSGQLTVGGIHRLTLGALGGQRYIHGLYGCRAGRRAAGAVYVSAGIGAARVDLRLGERARREIAVFELGAAPGAFPEHHAEQRPATARSRRSAPPAQCAAPPPSPRPGQ